MNLSEKTSIHYHKNKKPGMDEYIYCAYCNDLVFEYCSIHGPLLIIPDDKGSDKIPWKKLMMERFNCNKNIGSCRWLSFLVHSANKCGTSSILLQTSQFGAGLGVFSTLTLPQGVRFGPYKGEKSSETNSFYCWQIQGLNNRYVINAADANKSNWLRYINCARHWHEQNLVAYQYKGQIYYRTIKIIPKYTELMVFYGTEYAHTLNIDLMKYNTKFEKKKNTGEPVNNNISELVDDTTLINNYLEYEKFINKYDKFHDAACLSSIPEDHDKMFTNADQVNVSNLEVTQKSFKSNIIYKRDLYRYCKECKFKSFSLSTLEKHVMLHDISRKYACFGCGFRYQKQYQRKRHMKTCRFACKIELQSSHNHTDYDSHKYCNDCNFKTLSLSALAKHIMLHDNSRKYACFGCGLRHTTRRNQKKHIETCHFAREIQQSRQSSHDQIDFDSYKYCNECNFKTFSLPALEKHMMLHDESRKYMCLGCGYRYPTRYNQKRHMETCHFAGEKGLQKQSSSIKNELVSYKYCNECNFKTFSLPALEKHKMLHDKSRKYICTGCGLRYAARHNQKRHMETCRFAREIKLQSSNNQIELDSYKYCNECNFKTFSLPALEKHMMLHDESRKYTCVNCGLRYPTRYNQKRHMKTCHSVRKKGLQKQGSNIEKELDSCK